MNNKFFDIDFSFLDLRHLKLFLLVLPMVLFFYSCKKKKKISKETESQSLFQSLPSTSTGITFANHVKATERFNLFKYMYFYNGGGVAAGDLNGDGLDELYFTGNQNENKLYLNKGGLKFSDITAASNTGGVKGTWYTGVTFADINGDGKLDIYVGQINQIQGSNQHNLLFINIGNDSDGIPQFKEAAIELGLIVEGATTQSAFFDYDLDGDLDAYIMTHTNFNDGVLPRSNKRLEPSPYGDKLFRNDGDRFTNVTDQSGIYSSTLGFGLGINTSDINKDGYPDIYVGNDFYEDDYLYINNGDATFTEKLSDYIKHTSRFSMGNDISDMNNDGLPDILSLDMQAYEPEILKASHGEDSYPIFNYKLSFGYKKQFAHNTFQLNHDGSHFSEIARLAGIEATDWSWSVLGNDFDLDGRKDIFITNGIYKRSNDMDYMQFLSSEEIQKQLRKGNYDYSQVLTDKMPSYPLRNFFFRNSDTLTFSDVSETWGAGEKGFSNGATYTDLDNDGDMDLVINNLNETASVLKNTTIEKNHNNSKYLRVQLRGKKGNPFGVGAKVTIQSSHQIYYQELLTTRGYLSSVPPYLNFGIPSDQNIDSILIEWPDKTAQLLTDVKANQKLTVDQSNAIIPTSEEHALTEPIFKKIESSMLGVEYKHEENRFYEFNREHLIPHMNSTWGPPIAVADINADGFDDFFVGGALNQPSEIYIQNSNGRFSKTLQNVLITDAVSEDTAAQFFDADNDGDPDLLVGSGSNQELKPDAKSLSRLYLNDGKGVFTKHMGFSKIYTTVSSISVSDFDKDNDLDVFIGIRSVSGKYGLAPDSFLLENDGKGNFLKAAGSKKLFDKCGMVSSAKWVDLDGDTWEDLVIAGEWMPIKIYYNNKGKLTNADPKNNNLQFSNGWWNALELGDFDNDGDIDLVAGNLGLNAKLSASKEEPVTMYHADFDKNGWPEGIMTHFIDNKEHVFSSKSTLEKQLQYLRKKFTTYNAFATADFSAILSIEEQKSSLILKAYEFRSSFIENLGNKKFKVRALPKTAQYSMINTIKEFDFNRDGTSDIIMGGNFYEVNTELGSYDANYGTLLKNIGNTNFRTIPFRNTQLRLDQQVRSIKRIKNQKFGEMLLISNNNDSLEWYSF